MKRYPSRFITMVRFPCFPAPIHYKSKKSVQRSAETLHKSSRDFSQDQASKFSISSPGSHSLDSKPNACDNDHSNTSAGKITSSSSFGTPVPTTVQTWPDVDQEGFWKSEETQDISSPETNMEILRVINLKKSQSVGSRLDREGRISSDVVDTEDEIDHGLSCDYNPVMKLDGMFDSFDHNWLSESFDYKNPENNVLNPSNCLLGLPDQPNAAVESFQLNAGLTQDGSVASVGDLKQLEREVHEDFGKQLSAEHVSDCGHHTPDTYPTIAKSCSLPDLRACVERPGKDSVFLGVSVPYSRTFEDLTVRKRGILKSEDMLRSGNALYKSGCGSSCHNVSETSYLPGKEILEVSSTRHQILCQQILGEDSFLSNHSVGSFEMVGQDRECIIERDVHDYENQFSSGQHSGNMTDVMKNWTVAEKANGDSGERLHGESSIHNWDELPCTEFKIKRIEDWVSKIDIQNSALEEVGECSTSLLQAKDDSNAICGATATKTDARISRGMEVANNYISSLTAMSTSAQMANLGLVLVPRLSIFSGLRLINLSGNAIVRITAGALPKGLHMLNLSRNNISTIEGLRELTRLRVLDLSYNRICRIGHGLASCSSLKELYLTGNKISEVEGLHRLLKLNILDLRFNKISTAKCLGQLAANYGSLQIINLEGNPAQRNVGDEQLKKSLLSLLPHLIYLNRQPIKTSSSKEVADRATRSITAHQFDRGARSEHKLSRKSAHKPASLSSHGVMAQAAGSSSKPAKSRHARQPPGKAKRTLHQVSRDSKLLSLQGSSSMRRSRSEGSL